MRPVPSPRCAAPSAFEDCDGRQVDVTDLEPAAGVLPIVLDNARLVIDLRPNDTAAPTTSD